MGNGRIPRIVTYAITDLVMFKVGPFSGFPTTQGAPVEDFFANIPTPIIMKGDGRVYNHIAIHAASWHPGASAPSDSDIGIFHTIAFDAVSDDEVHHTLLIPFRMEAGTSIAVGVDWAYAGGADAGTVCWALEHKCIMAGEALAGGTTTIAETSPGSHTSGQLVRTTFTDQIAGCVAHDVLGLHLYRDVSEDTLGTDAELVSLHLEFTRDKHGLAV